MQLFRAHRGALRHASSPEYMAHSRGVAVSTEIELDPAKCRHEPETFGASIPTDSYASWLAQREAESQREASVRCIIRPTAVAGSMIRHRAAA
jgi:hypothetical protein